MHVAELAAADAVQDLLPIVDNLERALQAEGAPVGDSTSVPLHCEHLFQVGDDHSRTYGRHAHRRIYAAGDLPNAETYAERALRIPTYTEPRTRLVAQIVEAFEKVSRLRGDLLSGGLSAAELASWLFGVFFVCLFLRVPVAFSALMFMAGFPAIIGMREQNYTRVSGVEWDGHLARSRDMITTCAPLLAFAASGVAPKLSMISSMLGIWSRWTSLRPNAV